MIWQPAKYQYELRHYASDELIDSSVLGAETEIPFSHDALSLMADLTKDKSADDMARFFYFGLKTEREGKLSKEVRVYIYSGEEDPKFKIVRIERDG